MEQGFQAVGHLDPCLPIPRDGELRPGPLDIELAAHERVRTPHLPYDRASLLIFGHLLAAFHLDAVGAVRSLAPEFSGKVRTILPSTVAEPIRRLAAPGLATVRTRPPK